MLYDNTIFLCCVGDEIEDHSAGQLTRWFQDGDDDEDEDTLFPGTGRGEHWSVTTKGKSLENGKDET